MSVRQWKGSSKKMGIQIYFACSVIRIGGWTDVRYLAAGIVNIHCFGHGCMYVRCLSTYFYSNDASHIHKYISQQLCTMRFRKPCTDRGNVQFALWGNAMRQSTEYTPRFIQLAASLYFSLSLFYCLLSNFPYHPFLWV